MRRAVLLSVLAALSEIPATAHHSTAMFDSKNPATLIYNDPLTLCNSPGPLAYNAPYPFEFLTTANRITLITEYFHEVRRIYLDGRQHPPGNPDPTFTESNCDGMFDYRPFASGRK